MTALPLVLGGSVAWTTILAGCGGDSSSSDTNDTTPGGSASGGEGQSVGDGDAAGGTGAGGATAAGGASSSGGAMAGGTGGVPGDGAPSFCSDLRTEPTSDDWQSSQVYYENNRLVYAEDDEHNRIADFSYAGYHYGEVDPPVVGEAAFLAAESGDQTARIQAALDALSEAPVDASGFRGALVLGPGTFQVDGTIRVDASGIVLRGSGDGEDPGSNTVITAPGDTPHHRSVIVVGSGNGNHFSPEADGTRTSLSETRWTGSFELPVDDASHFSVGDAIIIRHPSTSGWIDAVDGYDISPNWVPGELDMTFRRVVTKVERNTLTIDAPIYDHLNLALSDPYVYRVEETDSVTHVGVESLRIDIQTAGEQDEDHAAHAISVHGTQDAWVRDVTALHFYYAAVRMQSAIRVTVDDVFALDPHSTVDGSRRYNFSADRETQLALVKNSHASNGRHHFVSNGTTSVSGFVVYNSISEAAYTSSEGHRRWTPGMLFDNLTEQNGRSTRVFGFYNRGNWGTSHWWSNTQSVAWNLDPGNGSVVVQKPPTGQNWAIGGTGTITGDGPFDGPAGFLEQNGPGLLPHSLYIAQLCERFWEGRLVAKVAGLPPFPSD